MIKDFNIFKTLPKDRYLRNINEEYYYDQETIRFITNKQERGDF
jgi:hypothetical protein